MSPGQRCGPCRGLLSCGDSESPPGCPPGHFLTCAFLPPRRGAPAALADKGQTKKSRVDSRCNIQGHLYAENK